MSTDEEPQEMEEEPLEMEESEMKDDEESDDDGLSDASEESDDVVDSAVAEDIAKFQESFQGITDRYRLIKRIGEGKLHDMALK
jgi:cell division control protein 7